MSDVALYLADGTVWPGVSVGAPGAAVGEAVFSTAMTGYQEALTDPSFARQILTFTAPMIGNYGVEEDASESARPHARAIVVREGRNASPNGREGFSDWLARHDVVGIQGLDTRMLTRRLRDGGTLRAAVSNDGTPAAELLAIVRWPAVSHAWSRPGWRRSAKNGRMSPCWTTASRARSCGSSASRGLG